MISSLPRLSCESSVSEENPNRNQNKTKQNQKTRNSSLQYCEEKIKKLGKSYVIRALQNLLLDTCIAASYFGIAAFNIASVTL